MLKTLREKLLHINPGIEMRTDVPTGPLKTFPDDNQNQGQ